MWAFQINAAVHPKSRNEQRVALENIQGRALRDAEDYSDESSDEEEESIDEESLPDQEVDLPLVFLGTAIHRERDQQSRRTLGVDANSDSPVDTQRNSDMAERQSTNKEAGSDGPSTPWKTSLAKQRIIDELKNSTSDIHLLVGQYTANDFSKVNFTRIQQKYAGSNNYNKSNFRENMKRLLKNLLNKTGPFKSEQVEPWYTSAKNVSRGYSLLFKLYMDPKHSRAISGMSAEEIWGSHPQFQLYELEKFKSYNKNMQTLTAKRKAMIEEEEESYRRDVLRLPEKGKTSRGIPFWHTHAASELLEQHVTGEMDGIIKKMKPSQIWKSRTEYQAFPLKIFRKHIYQERTKQLAAPYWQHKRNKNAREKYEQTEQMLKEWNLEQINRSVQVLAEDLERIGPLDG